jgi:PilZ domain-containing protein
VVEESEKGKGEPRGGRRFARFPVSVPVVVRTEQPPGQDIAGMVRNVSVGGLIAEFPQEISSATPVRLLLRTRRGPLEVEARVVWSAATKSKVRHGFAFTQPQDQDFAINLFIGENR